MVKKWVIVVSDGQLLVVDGGWWMVGDPVETSAMIQSRGNIDLPLLEPIGKPGN